MIRLIVILLLTTGILACMLQYLGMPFLFIMAACFQYGIIVGLLWEAATK